MTLAFFMVHVLHSFKSFDGELSGDGFDPLLDFPFAFRATFDDIVFPFLWKMDDGVNSLEKRVP